MAVSYVGVSNSAAQSAGTTTTAGTCSVTPTAPSGWANEDRVYIYQSHTHTAGSTPANWNALYKNVQVGSGTVAAGSGLRYVTCYWRDKTSGWSSMPAITLASTTQGSNSVVAVAVRRSGAAAYYDWNAPTYSAAGSDYGTADTSFSGAVSHAVHANGLLMAHAVENDNVTISSPGISGGSGQTFGTCSERADGGTATGYDVAIHVHTIPVTGSGTNTITLTGTRSGSSQGGVVYVEQTETYLPGGSAISGLTEDFADALDEGVWAVANAGSYFGVGYLAAEATLVAVDLWDITSDSLTWQVNSTAGSGSAGMIAGFVDGSGYNYRAWGFDGSDPGLGYAKALSGLTTVGTAVAHVNYRAYRIRHDDTTHELFWEYCDEPDDWVTHYYESSATFLRLDRAKPTFRTGVGVSYVIDNVNLTPAWPEPVPLNNFGDNFDYPSLSGSWTDGIGPGGQTFSNGRIVLDDATVDLTGVGPTGLGYVFDGNALKFQATGASFANPPATNGLAGVGLRDFGFTKYVQWGFDNTGSGTRATPDYGGATGTPVTVPDGRWFRIRASGSTVYWEYSDNGTSWSSAWSQDTDTVIGVDAAVYPFLNTNPGSVPNYHIEFDRFNREPPAATALSTLTDTFTGADDDPPDPAKWDVKTEDAPDPVIVGNALYLVAPENVGGFSYSQVNTHGYRDLTGSYGYARVGTLELDFTATLGVTTPDGEIGGWAFTSDGTVAAYDTFTQGNGTPFTHTPGTYYRIREASGTLYYDYSSNGTDWTNSLSGAVHPVTSGIWTGGYPDYTNVQFGFWVYNFGAGNSATAVLDNVNTTGGAYYTTSPDDTVGVVDAFSSGPGRTVTDPVGLVDALTTDTGRAAIDPVGIVDSATFVRGYNAAPTDPVGLVDDVTAAQGRVVSYTDTVGISDAASIDAGRSQTDPVGVVDDWTVARALPFTDPVGVTDSVSVDVAPATPTDAVGVTDALLVGFGTAPTDAVGIVDGWSVVSGVDVPASDLVGVTDSSTFDLAGATVSTSTDPVGLSDTLTLVVSVHQDYTDPVGVTDVLTLDRVDTDTDPVGISDDLSTVYSYGYAATNTDPVGLVDDLTAAQGFTDTHTDTIGLGDAIIVAIDVVAAPFTDPVGLVDSATFVVSLQMEITIGDLIGVVDVLAHNLTASTDRVGIVDTFVLASPPPEFPAETGPWTPQLEPLVSNDQIVSLHTHTGILLYQFGPESILTLKWSRELRDVSRCDLTLPPILDNDRLPDIMPWAHWISVWTGDGKDVLWTGPIQKLTTTRDSANIAARDCSAFMARTRNPLTKRWEGVDPCVPAGEMWQLMVEQHGLAVHPVIRPDPEGDRFDYAVKADAAMMDTTMSDLAGLGLRWSVIAGVPLIGPAGKDPITTLGEDDFLGGALELTRDGAASFNDVLVRGPDNLARARVPMHGLNLQTIVNVDSMFGVSNVDRAATQYARHTAAVRDAITLSSGSALHPDAPVTLSQLIPSARFVVEAFGLRTLMELEAMETTLDENNATVTVKMESVIDTPELADVKPMQNAVAP